MKISSFTKVQLDKNFQRNIMIIFLSTSFNICFFDALKNRLIETVLFEYPQHMFWVRNKKIIFEYALLSRGLI